MERLKALKEHLIKLNIRLKSRGYEQSIAYEIEAVEAEIKRTEHALHGDIPKYAR